MLKKQSDGKCLVSALCIRSVVSATFFKFSPHIILIPNTAHIFVLSLSGVFGTLSSTKVIDMTVKKISRQVLPTVTARERCHFLSRQRSIGCSVMFIHTSAEIDRCTCASIGVHPIVMINGAPIVHNTVTNRLIMLTIFQLLLSNAKSLTNIAAETFMHPM